jgi:hypothetical protein
MEIVVSRYNEDLKWTLQEPFCHFEYTVYNKGNNDNFEKSRVTKIVKIDNVGKECHTYLYHIIENYHNNQLYPITFFIPASVEIHYKYNKIIKTLDRMKDTEFTQAYFLAENCENAYEKFHDFQIDYWLGTNANNQQLNSSGNLEPCEYRPFHQWFERFFQKEEVIHWWSYNSIFAIDKRDILQHPRERYEGLMEGLKIGNNLEEVHYIERVWAAVFHPLTYTLPENYRQ